MKFLLPNTIATKISNKLIIYDNEFMNKKDDIRYGLEWIIAGMNQVILVLILSIPFNLCLEAFVVMVSGALLRMFAGGAHFRGYFPCLLFSTAQIMVIATFSKYYVEMMDITLYIFILALCISFVLTWTRSPLLMKKRNQFTQEQKQKAKYKAIITFMVLLILGTIILYGMSFMYAIWLAIIAQSFTLTKTAQKLFGFM